jgi:hypothetical protein
VIVELIGGPCDGMLWEMPDGDSLIIVRQPRMTPTEFIAMGERPDLVEYATMPVIEHAYVIDRKVLNKAGLRRFIYRGVRA